MRALRWRGRGTWLQESYLPNLPRRGHSTRVFKNQVVDNNTDNFARKGAAVASVPVLGPATGGTAAALASRALGLV